MSETIITEQLPTEPKPLSKYRRILHGLSRVVMGVLFPGSAHFLSGKRLAGIVWYLLGFLIGLSAVVALATPGKFFTYLAIILII
jgi:hypothetical protein